jgi:hypothetical protein
MSDRKQKIIRKLTGFDSAPGLVNDAADWILKLQDALEFMSWNATTPTPQEYLGDPDYGLTDDE